jgi:hypothetical protein
MNVNRVVNEVLGETRREDWSCLSHKHHKDKERFLDCAGRRVRGTNAEENVGLLRSE